jgi:phage terminase large subunit
VGTTKKMEKQNREVLATLYRKYKEDPVFFVEHALGHVTWGKQREILKSVKENKKTAVRACHGSSKTFTAAEITAWFLNCFENSKVITTAPTFFQIKNQLWAEINTIYTSSRIRLLGECLTTAIKTEKPDHYAIGFSTDVPARAEGWHAPEILFVFDEAKGIPQWLWDSVRGLMTGGFCRWLVISTTDGVEVGENFYKAFKDSDSDWNTIHISAYDSPYLTGEKFRKVEIEDPGHPEKFKIKYLDPEDITIQIADKGYIAEGKKEWGEDSVLFLTKVKGEVVDQGADTIIKLSQVLKMFENFQDKDFDSRGAEEAGVDVARGGTDDTVFFKRKGLKVTDYKIITSKELPPKEKIVFIADELEIFVGRNKKMKIKIDDTGVGGGLTDTMESRKYNVIPVKFGESAKDPDKYPNMIAEMWFEVAKIIQEIACPEISRLQKELVNRKYLSLDKQGRRRVESKEDYKKRTGLGSPDFADAFLLAFADAEKVGPRIRSFSD